MVLDNPANVHEGQDLIGKSSVPSHRRSVVTGRGANARGIIAALRGFETGMLRKGEKAKLLQEAAAHFEEDCVIHGQVLERNCQVCDPEQHRIQSCLVLSK